MRRLRQALSRFTPLSLSLSVLIFCGFLLTLAAPNLKRFLVLVPAKASFALWTCATSSFVVLNPLELLIDIVALLFVGQIVEPEYGAFELMKYLLLVAAATGGTTFAVAYTTFVIRRVVRALYPYSTPPLMPAAVFSYLPIYGFHGLLGALLVAFKHVAPDHVLIFFDVLRVRAEWLPSLYVLVGLPLGLLYQPLNFYPFLLFGTYFGWFYLRFVQVDPRTKLRGDPSPSFSFASFFPEFMRPLVNPAASFCSKIFHIRTNEPIPSAYPPPSHSFETEAGDQARRRERGQKALEARLSGMNGRGAGSYGAGTQESSVV